LKQQVETKKRNYVQILIGQKSSGTSKTGRYPSMSSRMLKLQEAGRELRCWYAWPPSNVEWSWLEMNKSKFNATCQALRILGWMICDG